MIRRGARRLSSSPSRLESLRATADVSGLRSKVCASLGGQWGDESKGTSHPLLASSS